MSLFDLTTLKNLITANACIHSARGNQKSQNLVAVFFQKWAEIFFEGFVAPNRKTSSVRLKSRDYTFPLLAFSRAEIAIKACLNASFFFTYPRLKQILLVSIFDVSASFTSEGYLFGKSLQDLRLLTGILFPSISIRPQVFGIPYFERTLPLAV